MVHHPIAEDILADYAGGNLSEAFNLVVAAHVSLSDEARGRLSELERLGGALLDDLDGVEMAHGSLEAMLRRLDSTEPEPEPATEPTVRCDVLPRPVADYIGGDLSSVRWRSVGMGCKQAILTADKTSSARLLYIPAGCAMPDHGHRGMEVTLVLQGAVLDGAARFARGDVDVANEDTEHTPVADITEDCICLVACEGSLRFNSLLPRIAQPFFRI